MAIWKPQFGVQLNRSHPLAPDLICYVFNSGSGHVFFDYATGTLFDPGSWVIGENSWGETEKGISYRFCMSDTSGFGNYISLGAITARTVVTCWKNESSSKASSYITDFRNASGTGYAYWTYATGIITSSSGTKYVNGAPGSTMVVDAFNTVAITGITLSTSGNGLFGAYKDLRPDFRIKGYVEYAYYYSRDLTAEEIASLHRDPYQMFRTRSPVSRFYVPAAGGAISAEATDGFIASETLAKIATLRGSAVDGFSGGDAGSKLAQFVSASVDGAVFAEAISKLATLSGTSVDGAALSDIDSGIMIKPAAATDGGVFSETMSGRSNLVASTADGLKFSEALATAAALIASATDGANFIEELIAAVESALSGDITEGLRFSDTPSPVGTFLKSVSDQFDLSETIIALMTRLASLSDGSKFSETVARTLTQIAAATDGGVLGDQTSVITSGLAAAIIDGLSLSDVPGVNATFTVTATDSAQFSEAAATIMRFATTVSDSFVMTDIAFHLTATGELTVTFQAKKSTITFVLKKRLITFQ